MPPRTAAKTPPLPLVRPGRPTAELAPFSPEEADEVLKQMSRQSRDAKAVSSEFGRLREALAVAHAAISLDLVPTKKLSDVKKPLNAAANTGRLARPSMGVRNAIEYGAALACVDIAAIKAGDADAIRQAAKAALKSNLLKDRAGRPMKAARDQYVAVARSVYEQLTGRPATFTRTTGKRPGAKSGKNMDPGKIVGSGADFMRAALAPLGASDDQVAEAILNRRRRPEK